MCHMWLWMILQFVMVTMLKVDFVVVKVVCVVVSMAHVVEVVSMVVWVAVKLLLLKYRKKALVAQL